VTSQHYAILGYIVAAVAMWGYAAVLYLEHRRLSRIERTEEGV